MKRKVISVVLAAAMAVGMLAGCGNSAASTATSTAASKAASTATSKAASTATSKAASTATSKAASTATSKAASTAASSASGASDTAAALSVKADKSYNIEVILKTLASEYWGYVNAGCAQAGKDLNVNVEVVGAASETAYDEQMNMITTALGSNSYDALVIAPLQADMVATQIASTSLPIIAVDTKITSDKVLTFVGTGNEAAGKQGGEAAVKYAKDAGWTDLKAILISGVQGDTTATDRGNGYKEGIEAAGGTFLSDETQYADAVADKAVTCMEAIIQNHPEGIAMIVCNNDDMAMAAARAASGNEAYAKTVFVGFDGITSACDAILAGQETMSVAQDAYHMGYYSVQAAIKALQGDKLEAFYDSGTSIINKDNAQERKDTLNGYSK